jgi:predicted  nucleic acid-binding Zn-ribbon protein
MDISKLYELQRLDSQQERAKRKVLQIRTQLVESPELRAARTALAEAEAELARWQAGQKEAELEARSLRERIADGDRRLMSGEVHNPKELKALNKSVEALRRQQGVVEDAGIEAVSQSEHWSRERAQRHAALETIEAAWKSSQSELVAEETKYRRAYTHLKNQRVAHAASLAPADVTLYESLRSRKGGVAVTTIRASQCTACNMFVPTGVASSVRTRPTEAIFCPSCGRILWSGGE